MIQNVMTNRIRILFTGLDHSNCVGGIETYILKIVSNIDRSKFQIDFLVFDGSEPCFYNELKSLGCKFYFITSRRKSFFKNRCEVKNLFKKEHFDIVHCHLNSLSYITPCVYASQMKIPVILHSRNAGCLQSRLSQLLHKINFFRIKKLPLYKISVSDLAGKWMFGSEDFVVYNNGIDITKFKYDEEKRLLKRKELEISNSTEVFVHVGAFRIQKNHIFLINLFERYAKINPDSLLLLVGEGRLKQEIELKVSSCNLQKNIMFLGNRNDIPEILSAADKFIFPSLYEGFPNALLEAECSGLHCIVADTITKQVEIQNLCTYLPLDCPMENWLEAMSRVSHTDRSIMGEYIRIKEFDIQSEIKKLEGLYNSLSK